MKLSKAAQEAIRLADARRQYWDAELPKRHPDYPLVHMDEDSGPPPPEEKQLRELLSSLPEDFLYKLLLIMYLGRPDFGTNALAADYGKLRRTFRKPEWATAQMLRKATLGDDLSDGLEKLNKAGIDVDEMDFKPAKPRK
jgi:hypothetical protein